MENSVDPVVKEILAKIARENSYIRGLNLEFLEIKKGYVKGRMRVTEGMLNPYGSVHGGCLFSLADITAGTAACTYGKFASTVEGAMDYLVPAMDTEYITCEVKELRNGKKVSRYEAYLYDDRGTLVDKAKFTFYMMDRTIE